MGQVAAVVLVATNELPSPSSGNDMGAEASTAVIKALRGCEQLRVLDLWGA